MPIFKSEATDDILEKSLAGERITREEAVRLYRDADFLKVQAAARELRSRKIDSKTASYTIFHVINYTNFCNVECNFCSFMEETASGKGYTLSSEQIVEKMQPSFDKGVHQMFLQGGVNPDLPFDYYLNILRDIKSTFGTSLHIRGFSPVELIFMEKITGLKLSEVLKMLKDAGLDSVPGAGAEILTERMRNILSPKKSGVDEWVRVMETCHGEGLYGSANVVFGSEETQEEVIEHLDIVRSLQDRTKGFFSFVPWTFQQQTKRFKTRGVPAHEYLKVLGICRIFLDNIDHIETSIMVLGPGVGGLALHSGADDISSVVIEENVLRSHSFRTEEKARKFIEDSGFRPVRRDFLYNPVEGVLQGA